LYKIYIGSFIIVKINITVGITSITYFIVYVLGM